MTTAPCLDESNLDRSSVSRTTIAPSSVAGVRLERAVVGSDRGPDRSAEDDCTRRHVHFPFNILASRQMTTAHFKAEPRSRGTSPWSNAATKG